MMRSSQIFFTELLSMEGKYAVKLSITDLIKISRKLRKRYNGRLWKIQMWPDSMSRIDTCTHQTTLEHASLNRKATAF